MTPRATRSAGATKAGWIVAALCTGTVLSALNSGMIAVALLSLRTAFGIDVATVTWVITAFYLTSAVLQPVMGRLADRYGPRRVFLVGTAIVAVAGAGGAFAPDIWWLCAARVVLAVGTATTFPAAAAILRAMAPERGLDAPRLIGRVQLIDTSTAAIGPVIGGALIALAGWPAVMWINIPLAALAAASVLVAIPRDPPRAPSPLRVTLRESDLPGLLAFAAAVIGLLVFLLGLSGGFEPIPLIVAVVGMGLFVWRELTAATPFVDLRRLAGIPALVRVYVLYVVANVVLYATLFGIPQYLEDFASYGTAAIGAMMVPLAAFNVVLARPIEELIARRGIAVTMTIGTIGLVVAGALLPLLALHTPVWLVLVAMSAVGVPFAFVLVSLTQSLSLAAPVGAIGESAGLFQTARSIGCITAAAVVGIAFTGDRTGADDWIVLSITIAGCAMLLAAATAVTVRLTPRR